MHTDSGHDCCGVLLVTNDDNIIFWDCREAEELTHTEIDCAIEDWLDDLYPTPIDELPVTIEVTGYVRRVVDLHQHLDSGGVLERLLEELDEEYGSHEREPTEPTMVMRAIEQMFVEAVISEYEVWSCTPVKTETINVYTWITENAPEWLKETA